MDQVSNLLTCLLLGSTAFVAHGASVSIEKTIDIRLGSQTPFPSYFVKQVAEGEYVSAGFDNGFGSWSVRKFTREGATIWSNTVPLAPGGQDALTDLLVASNRDLLVFTAPRTIRRLSADGQFLETRGPWTTPWGNSQTLVRYQNGYLLGGMIHLNGSDAVHIIKLDSALNFEWERTHISGSAFSLCDLRAASGGGYIYCVANGSGNGIAQKINQDGAIGWIIAGRQQMTATPTRDGGCVLVFWSREQFDGQTPFFGGDDCIIIKLDATGNRQWTGSFGGIGVETPGLTRPLVETEGGNLLLVLASHSSGISGNKNLAGDGLWILRLDSDGTKRNEWILPGTGRDLFRTTEGFSIVTDDLEGGKIADFTISRGIRVKARSTGTPYNVDISSDLLNWATLVNGFDGDLELSERIGLQNKFFRVTEIR